MKPQTLKHLCSGSIKRIVQLPPEEDTPFELPGKERNSTRHGFQIQSRELKGNDFGIGLTPLRRI
jgi:hypothetical protein